MAHVTVMADVPEYIMEAARECCAGFFTGHRELYVEDVARAMAALSERERRTAQGVTWQPIETAPKDWTDVLLYLPDEDDGDGRRGVVTGWFSMADGGFNCWMSYDVNSGACHPTHWMPLPAAPSLSTSAGGGE